jgi:hypothetical protein
MSYFHLTLLADLDNHCFTRDLNAMGGRGRMNQDERLKELDELRQRVQQIETELANKTIGAPPMYYTAYQVLAGFVLGIFGATTSLLFNIVGSLIIGQHPLELIRVYLTFPMGEAIYDPRVPENLALAIGCFLYLGTGMLLGIPYQLVLTKYFPNASIGVRFMVVTIMSLALWLINFYGILSWLQPALFGGRWILDRIPPWVAAATHLVFGWTILLGQQTFGAVPTYKSVVEES